MKKTFYGWWVVVAAFVTFGLSVGLPYYNISFFYDYFENTYKWSKPDITLGFPLAALPIVFIGPLVIHRFSPRKLIVAGTGLTFVSFMIFANMGDGPGTSIWIYYLGWFVYSVGFIMSGPVPHQLIIAQWFKKNRGKAMGLLYVGVGLFGFFGAKAVKPLTEDLNFHKALMIIGAAVLLAWPLAFFVLRDKPSEKGQFPDGADTASAEISAAPRSYRYLIRRYSFWLILFGSMCSIGSIGAVNFLMKFVFKEQMDPSITDPAAAQALLNSTWQSAQMIILISSIGGRILIGAFSDKFSTKIVMVVSYFMSAATILLLATVRPPTTPWVFAVLFGFAMGADYMLIPLMAAEQFGVNSLARAMAIILPVNTLAQTWFPWMIAKLQVSFGSFQYPLYLVFGVGVFSGVAIALLPRPEKEPNEEVRLQDTGRATTSR